MGAIVVVYVIVIIFPSLGVNWAFLALLPLLLPLLLVIATSRVIWKSVTENPWFQQAKMPRALVWQIRGCASEQGVVEVGPDLEVVQVEYQDGPDYKTSIFVSKFPLLVIHSFGTKSK